MTDREGFLLYGTSFCKTYPFLQRKRTQRKLCPLGCLLCVLHGFGFADHVDLDLAGVFQLGFDLLGNVSCQQDHVVLGDNLGLDHDADLPACLNGEGLDVFPAISIRILPFALQVAIYYIISALCVPLKY